jgi:hypothetical protein
MLLLQYTETQELKSSSVVKWLGRRLQSSKTDKAKRSQSSRNRSPLSKAANTTICRIVDKCATLQG